MQTEVTATHGVPASKFVMNHHHLLRYDCGEIVQRTLNTKIHMHYLSLLSTDAVINQEKRDVCSLFIT